MDSNGHLMCSLDGNLVKNILLNLYINFLCLTCSSICRSMFLLLLQVDGMFDLYSVLPRPFFARRAALLLFGDALLLFGDAPALFKKLK